jgi:hypothetical protein
LVKVASPKVITKVFSEDDYAALRLLFQNPKSLEYQEGFSRYVVADNSLPELQKFADKLTNIARETFGSKELLPTYTLFSHYEGENPAPSLYKHKDDNACTYTIDMCLYQTDPWDLYVEDKAYTLYPNQALAYFGNDQMHWREKFPKPGSQYVAMIFFHFAEPDHWFFTKGPSYLSVIRKEMTEEEWKARS